MALLSHVINVIHSTRVQYTLSDPVIFVQIFCNKKGQVVKPIPLPPTLIFSSFNLIFY